MDLNIDELVADMPGLVANNDAPSAPEPVDDTETQPPAAETESETSTDSNEDSSNKQADTPNTDAQNKSARAFAQLRTENSKQKAFLKELAKISGIPDETDDTKFYESIKNKILETQAQAQNVPKEVLAELNQLKEYQRNYEFDRRRERVAQELNSLQQDFKLDDKAMSSFITDCVQAGLNPYEKDINLRNEYISRHWNDLLSAAEERGRLAEQQRAAHAQTHSTTPGKTQGSHTGGSTGGQKIDSVSALNSFLDSLKK